MRFKTQINLLLGLVVGIVTGWLLGTFQSEDRAGTRANQNEVLARKAEDSKSDGSANMMHIRTRKTIRSEEALRALALAVQLQNGRIEEVRSNALQEVRAYYLEFGPGAVAPAEDDALQ